MANTSIFLKRTSVSGRVPKGEDIGVGELAVNLADGLLFTKQGNGNVISISGTGTKGDKGDIGDKGEKGDPGSFDVTADTFTANGTATDFTLSTTPIDETHLFVQIGGVLQLRSAYTLTGNTLSFSEAPEANAQIEVTTIEGGAKGDKGDKGVDGTIGVDGAKGEKGDTGATGTAGDKGDKGDTGTTGDKGDKGDTGSQGDKGDTGAKGEKGETGAKGEAGVKGDLGTTGDKGQKGEEGAISSYTYANSNITASPFDVIIADTQNGSFTVTLPSSPTQGDWVKITDGYNWDTNPLTVARNGSTIEGSADDLVMDIGNIISEFTFTGNTWVVFTTAGTKGDKGEAGIASLTYLNRTYTANGACTQFTVTSGMTNTSVIVTENGIMQEPEVDYTVANTTLTFTTAPDNGVKVMIRELPV